MLEDLARHGRPTVAGLQRAARMPRPPHAVDARWLGGAQRDLKALRRHPSALTLIEEARRVFHPHGRELEGLMVRLAELPEARHIAVETFSRFPRQGWARHLASLQLAARARGQDATTLLDELCSGWVSCIRGEEDFYGYLFLPPALLEALERAAIAQGGRVSLRFYYSLPSPGMASRFLDRMLAAFPVEAPRMK